MIKVKNKDTRGSKYQLKQFSHSATLTYKTQQNFQEGIK